jgi:ATP-dependent Zn protease
VSSNQEAAKQRSTFSRVLTWLAALSTPSIYAFYNYTNNWSVLKTVVITLITVVIFRAILDWLLRQVLPPPSLFGNDDPDARANDIMDRRRFWFWRFWTRLGVLYTLLVVVTMKHGFVDQFIHLGPHIENKVAHPQFLLQFIQVAFLFAANFLIFMGPMMMMGISQIKTFEPGDANWGVKLSDVRGQKEPKEEVRRIVEIWQSGEDFEKLGGKRERGMLFLGPPGVGKTMMAKAIATEFNSPFITIPGSGFAQTFIGIDAIIVRFLARKAKKVSRKWGGTCIVFIDEIDAVGMRRNSLGGGMAGGMGGMMGGMMGGQMALNQLLVVMDSIDSPPGLKMFFVKKVNLLLDASYFVPRKLWKIPLRMPPLKPRKDQIFFVGATNVPLENLDPALVRAGRMGRHVWFRTPTKDDRKDVFDLYMKKVAHEPELDTDERREEIARVTQGVSPASIEQICSMALLNAQNDGRRAFNFKDMVEALTTLEAGTAVGIEYTEDETQAVALHEAGHASAGHVYQTREESSRLSIRMRGQSLGHHQSFEKEERFGSWRSDDFHYLIRILAAYAAEYVFYGENGRGVTGDLMMATSQAATMVGASGMTPYHADSEDADRFEKIGRRLVSRAETSKDSPLGGILSDRYKGRDAAIFLGHAFVTAWNFISINKEQVQAIADKLVEEKEIFGNDLTRLLDEQDLVRFDYTDIESYARRDNWPVM